MLDVTIWARICAEAIMGLTYKAINRKKHCMRQKSYGTQIR